ncbi:MAG TPA: NADP-dependent oxidoreductase [Solirubrobacteraceae bacterium]
MRAVQFSRFGGPEVLEMADVPEPHPEPGQIRVAVRAAGVNPIDWKVRSGAMGGDLPRRVGQEVAGIVDELGDGVSDVSVGDEVFGFPAGGGGAAEYAVLSSWARKPSGLDFAGAAALPVAVETAVRCLDLLGVTAGQVLVINGASGAVGQAAVQLARLRGATVIGTAGPDNQQFLRDLGAEPTTYGEGLADRVRAATADGRVDRALDASGGGVLPDLVELTGSPDNVVTIADFIGAQETGVRATGGSGSERAVHALADVVPLIERGEFSLPVAHTFPLDRVAEAQRLGEAGHAPGKLVLMV